MRILVACEESGRVTEQFRLKGHEAYSCDIIPTSGEHPEWHIYGDVTPLLEKRIMHIFRTQDRALHQIDKWDMIIAFPPCTHLAVSGARHFGQKREDGRQKNAIQFFSMFLEADCEKICIENPIGIIAGDYVKKWFPELAEEHDLPIKPTQIIQPYQFGHPYTKSTCLWLKNLPKLVPTDIIEKPATGWVNQAITKDGRYGGFNKNFQGSTERSKTFMGIAKAMAEQWG